MSEPPVLLVEPRDGLPTVVADTAALAETIAAEWDAQRDVVTVATFGDRRGGTAQHVVR